MDSLRDRRKLQEFKDADSVPRRKVSTEGNDPKLFKHYGDFDFYLKDAKKNFDARWKAEFRPTVNFDNFEPVKTLGTGAFGRVLLMRDKAKDKVYAVKMMDKKYIMKTKQLAHTHSEIRVLDAVNFPFLMYLQEFFTNNCYIFVAMPFMIGGEMFNLLRKQGKFDESSCRFYAAQVILGFEYLHYMGMVYRDLKPENIMLAQDGYLRITDMGFCKKIDDNRTYTLCGTPEYLAPEIIMNHGYNKSVDWWSCGILIYEMAAGYPPFYSKDPMKLYDKIVVGKFSFPQHFSKALQHLLNNMIQVDKTKRFGILKNGSKDIKGHDWFKAMDWEAVLEKKVNPSYKPRVKGSDDTDNFDKVEEVPMRTCIIEEYPQEFAEIKVKQTPERARIEI